MPTIAGLRQVLQRAAKKSGIALPEGVYAWLSGPSFETPAEIRMVQILLDGTTLTVLANFSGSPAAVPPVLGDVVLSTHGRAAPPSELAAWESLAVLSGGLNARTGRHAQEAWRPVGRSAGG